MLVTGTTSSKLQQVKSYSKTQPYQVGIKGVTEVTSEYVIYKIDNIEYKTFFTGNTVFSYNVTNKFTGEKKDFVYDEKTPYIKTKEENNINIKRNEFSVFESMYKLSQVDDIADFNDFPDNYL